MVYLIIEHYKDGDAVRVYRRFRERGRMAPAGLAYGGSWVTEDLCHCYQIMECADRALLDRWMDAWRDIVDFEVVPVLTSTEAQRVIASRLRSSRDGT